MSDYLGRPLAGLAHLASNYPRVRALPAGALVFLVYCLPEELLERQLPGNCQRGLRGLHLEDFLQWFEVVVSLQWRQPCHGEQGLCQIVPLWEELQGLRQEALDGGGWVFLGFLLDVHGHSII